MQPEQDTKHMLEFSCSHKMQEEKVDSLLFLSRHATHITTSLQHQRIYSESKNKLESVYTKKARVLVQEKE